MAKKKIKSAEDIIYEIKDLLDDLQLKLDPEDSYDDESEDDLEIDDDEDEDNEQLILIVWVAAMPPIFTYAQFSVNNFNEFFISIYSLFNGYN